MHDELKVIIDLMQDLQGKMEYGEEDFSDRLGRKKPGIEVTKIEGELPEELEEGFEDEPLVEEEEIGIDAPIDADEKLKQRLMKLRG
jgi:division protein CdvB (Snf7/Vps24/ESCRT-III family)